MHRENIQTRQSKSLINPEIDLLSVCIIQLVLTVDTSQVESINFLDAKSRLCIKIYLIRRGGNSFHKHEGFYNK